MNEETRNTELPFEELIRKYQPKKQYDFPKIDCPLEPEQIAGKYGRMRMTFLKEHRPKEYETLLKTGDLGWHLWSMNNAAKERMEAMLPKLAAQAGATEELKQTDPMKWIGLMNNCKAQAEEIICQELIYV